jgi:hypothetical protein
MDRENGVETDVRYGGCRVSALGRHHAIVVVHFVVTSAERYDAVAALDGIDPWVPLALDGPLEVCLTYPTADAAAAEQAVLDHWGETGSWLDVTFSAAQQGVLICEPATGLFTGMRLPPELLDAA